MPNVPEWLWIVIVASWVVTFAMAEGYAIFNGGEERADNAGDTLSKYIRKWLGVYPENPSRRHVAVPLFVAGLVGLAAWLIWHFLSVPPA